MPRLVGRLRLSLSSYPHPCTAGKAIYVSIGEPLSDEPCKVHFLCLGPMVLPSLPDRVINRQFRLGRSVISWNYLSLLMIDGSYN
mgnify:CR=1 FL=1